MDQQDALPPLPEAGIHTAHPMMNAFAFGYHADQMYDYARQAVLMERQRCAQVCRSRYMGDNTREDMEARACAEAILKGTT